MRAASGFACATKNGAEVVDKWRLREYNVPIRTMAEVADWHEYPRQKRQAVRRGKGRPPKCLARCFRAGCWAGTEDVPDCHLPGRRMECTHGIKTSVLSPVQLPVGVYRALFLQNKEEL